MKFQSVSLNQCPFCYAKDGEDHLPNCPVVENKDIIGAASTLRSQSQFWKEVSAYLTQCHVATLIDEGRLKSCPASRRRRYTDIVRNALSYLRMSSSPPFRGTNYFEHAVKSCQEALKEAE